MFQLLKQKKLRFSTKEVFFFEFFNNPNHLWINENRYIKANFQDFFENIPLTTLRKLWGNNDILFVHSSGRYSCAIETLTSSIIMVFPELYNSLKSLNSTNAKAILAHELGHLINQHSHRSIDLLEAQVEADKFAIDLGFAEELEKFLLDQSESLEKRVRLSYITAHYFANNPY